MTTSSPSRPDQPGAGGDASPAVLPPVLTAEQEAFRQEVHRIAEEVLRPTSIELDRVADPQEVIAPDSPFWSVMRLLYELGYHARGFPGSDGGTPMRLGPVESHIFSEEMGWGACDLSLSLGVTAFPFRYAAASGNPELIERFVGPYVEDREARYVGCWAITEPMHGSDTLNLGDASFTQPSTAHQLRARRVGDEWVISGQKSAWVSNGTIATHALAFLGIDTDRGAAGGGVAFIPLDLPGVSKGPPLDKIGQRALNQGEIFFDEVHIPRSYMLVEPDAYPQVLHAVLTGANAGMGSTFTGVARAAYEEALSYARDRVQGGRAIAEHQLVQKTLFDMFRKVEAARQLSRGAVIRSQMQGGNTLQYSIASKVTATQTAFEVASDAIQLHGGFGLTKHALVEKLMRDARASMIEDGVNELLSLVGARQLLA